MPRARRPAPVHATLRLSIHVDGAPWVAGMYVTERSSRRARAAGGGLVRELVDVDKAYHGAVERDWKAHGAPRLPPEGVVVIEANMAPRGQPPAWREAHRIAFAGIPVLPRGAAAPPVDWPASRWFQLGDGKERYVVSAQCALRAPVAQQCDKTGAQYVYELVRVCVSTPEASTPAGELLAL